MKQITEDYVSFEIAKLLKEKGFDELCFALYNPEKELIQCGVKLSNTQVGRVPGSYSAPTHQMALKWLRENNFHIILDIEVDYDEDERGMKWYHKSAWYWIVYRIDDREQMSDNGDLYSTYEEACEAAIKYCLENLI